STHRLWIPVLLGVHGIVTLPAGDRTIPRAFPRSSDSPHKIRGSDRTLRPGALVRVVAIPGGRCIVRTVPSSPQRHQGGTGHSSIGRKREKQAPRPPRGGDAVLREPLCLQAVHAECTQRINSPANLPVHPTVNAWAESRSEILSSCFTYPSQPGRSSPRRRLIRAALSCRRFTIHDLTHDLRSSQRRRGVSFHSSECRSFIRVSRWLDDYRRTNG